MQSRTSSFVVWGVAGYLVLTWALVFVWDFSGLIDHHTLAWAFLFSEGSPTEWLQWIALAGCVLTCGFLWGRAQTLGRPYAPFFGILGMGLCLMLIEDAGNLRHGLSKLVLVDFLGLPGRGLAKSMMDLVVYSALAGLMVAPFVLYLRQLRPGMRASVLFLSGYAAYGLAAFSSASAYVGNWYARVGNDIIAATGIDIDARLSWTRMAEHVAEGTRPDLGFWMMDFLYEESLELLGAGMILAALLSLVQREGSGGPSVQVPERGGATFPGDG